MLPSVTLCHAAEPACSSQPAQPSRIYGSLVLPSAKRRTALRLRGSRDRAAARPRRLCGHAARALARPRGLRGPCLRAPRPLHGGAALYRARARSAPHPVAAACARPRTPSDYATSTPARPRTPADYTTSTPARPRTPSDYTTSSRARRSRLPATQLPAPRVRSALATTGSQAVRAVSQLQTDTTARFFGSLRQTAPAHAAWAGPLLPARPPSGVRRAVPQPDPAGSTNPLPSRFPQSPIRSLSHFAALRTTEGFSASVVLLAC